MRKEELNLNLQAILEYGVAEFETIDGDVEKRLTIDAMEYIFRTAFPNYRIEPLDNKVFTARNSGSKNAETLKYSTYAIMTLGLVNPNGEIVKKTVVSTIVSESTEAFISDLTSEGKEQIMLDLGISYVNLFQFEGGIETPQQATNNRFAQPPQNIQRQQAQQTAPLPQATPQPQKQQHTNPVIKRESVSNKPVVQKEVSDDDDKDTDEKDFSSNIRQTQTDEEEQQDAFEQPNVDEDDDESSEEYAPDDGEDEDEDEDGMTENDKVRLEIMNLFCEGCKINAAAFDKSLANIPQHATPKGREVLERLEIFTRNQKLEDVEFAEPDDNLKTLELIKEIYNSIKKRGK